MTSIDELFERAGALVDTGRVPACQVAVGHLGEVVAFETFGAATNTTRFCIFSATKPIVASVVWLLIGDGLVDPSEAVARYVPELETAGLDQVTLEQVLLHTAGFPNAPMATLEGADPQRRRARFATWEPEWPPGTRFEYHAESAHWVLAEVIDRLSGRDYRDVLEERVCAPLGLPRALGIPVDAQHDLAPLIPLTPNAERDPLLRFNDPAVRAAGNPAGGAFMTAADLARFYQGLLHNPHDLWDAAVLRDATTNIRCTYDDPFLGVSANRTIGLVVAGDDGNHELRYAIFGRGCSPAAFGHAGAHAQVGWADPASGISFAFLTNAIDEDMMRSGARASRLATIAADLEL
jgi:Beta-lactamase class C and other penicillin binding proteins